MHTTALPAGGLFRRATITRRTPATLASFLDAYSAELQCSRKAAAWELRETFAELAAKRGQSGADDPLSRHICWVGSVANPAAPRDAYTINPRQLAAYFAGNMTAAGAPLEFVECSTQAGEPCLASDAAVAFAPEPMARILEGQGRPVPAFLLREPAPAGDQSPDADDIPKGRRLGVVRRLVHGLMEIAANAARMDRDGELCKQVARLDPEAKPTTSARQLLSLAKELGLEDFPGKESVKALL